MEISSFADSLSLFTQNRPVETLGLNPCRFDTLYTIDTPVQEPFNMRKGVWPQPDDYQINPIVMQDFREVILDRLGVERRPPTRRIFLARGHGRRSYTQDVALNIAEGFGFEAVYPEKLSFRDQVQPMHDAANVVGPSGASFANTFFCLPGAKLLSWLIPEY